MGFLVSIGLAIASIVGTVITLTITIVTTAMCVVVDIAAGVMTAITSGLSAGLAATISNLSTTFAALKATLAIKFANLWAALTQAYVDVKLWIEAVHQTWQVIAQAIHLDVLLKLHQVALVLSDSYRGMITRVYNDISRVSGALGMGLHGMNLLLRNARALILDASSSLGEPYDIGEIRWIGSLSNFLTQTQDRLMLYKDHPHLLYADIDELLIRDAVDTKAAKEAGLLATIDSTLEHIKDMAGDVITVKNDLENLIAGLPENIRTKIEQYTDPILNRVDEFIEEKYLPKMGQLDNIVDVLQGEMNTHQNNIDGIINRILRPGDYLLEIDSMTHVERIDQENKISEISTRPYRRSVEELDIHTQEIRSELDSIVDLIELDIPLPAWHVPEKAEPVELPQSEIGKEKTWYVGDY